MANDAARKKAIERATRDLVDAKNVGADHRPRLPDLEKELGFKVTANERDDAFESVSKSAAPVAKPRLSDAKRPADLSDDLHAETLVQIAATLMRKGRVEGDGRPGHIRLASAAAMPCSLEMRDWACQEAYARSQSLDHGEIVRKGMFAPDVQDDQDDESATV